MLLHAPARLHSNRASLRLACGLTRVAVSDHRQSRGYT
jgi:hypothetical protein